MYSLQQYLLLSLDLAVLYIEIIIGEFNERLQG
jgi:hypothetical protein